MQRAELFEAPKDILFTLKDIIYTPETPRIKEPFTVRGKVELLKIPFLAPIWVQARVTYPEAWWEEIIPIIGSPTVAEGEMAIGGDFEIAFPKGFDREGEFTLEVLAYAGPTYSIDKITLPPFPPVDSEKMTFMVAGEIPPEELGFREFRIISYSKNGGPPVTPPGVLELEVGDRCRVNVGFDHKNGAVTGKFHAAIWQKRLWDPHDEVLNADKAFSVPATPDWEPVTDYIDIPITSAIGPGSKYGLYVKIMSITGGDIFTEYLENVITIVGPPPEADIADWDFKATKGTYELGAKVPFTADYKYKGITQAGQLTIEIGTGVYPTFNAVYTYEPFSVKFEAAFDWESRSLDGNITLPDILEPGQTYSIRAKLESLDVPAQETDTDWTVITIKPGPPASDLALPDPGFEATPGTYDLGDSVPWTMVYQYKGKAQSGRLTISLGTGTYPSFFTKHTFPRISVSFAEAMDWTPGQLSGSFTLPTTLEPGQTYNVRAKLETADGVQETDTDWGIITITGVEILEVNIDPIGAGYVTTEPEPAGGTQHNWQFPYGTTVNVTAHPNPGYVFYWWSGEMTDTPEITAPVYPMTEHRKITAHFKEEVAPPPKADISGFDFVASAGTYRIGDKVPFSATYLYKGKAQNGRLTISLGTGIYPSFFTKHTFSPVSVSFNEAMDWNPGEISGSLTLPSTLTPGQTYNVRAKLEAIEDYAQETDTDWTVITVEEAPPAEYTLEISIEPPATGYVQVRPLYATYPAGTSVELTAVAYPTYEFDHWGGDAYGMGSQNPITITMNKDTWVVAAFRKVAVEEYTLTLWESPVVAWVKVNDEWYYGEELRYAKNEVVKLEAVIMTEYEGWYAFDYWDINGSKRSYNPCSVIMTKDTVATVYFKRIA